MTVKYSFVAIDSSEISVDKGKVKDAWYGDIAIE